MNVEEVKELRQKLAADVTEMINQFQKQSGCTVERVSLRHLVTDVHGEAIRTIVDIEVRLP